MRNKKVIVCIVLLSYSYTHTRTHHQLVSLETHMCVRAPSNERYLCIMLWSN